MITSTEILNAAIAFEDDPTLAENLRVRLRAQAEDLGTSSALLSVWRACGRTQKTTDEVRAFLEQPLTQDFLLALHRDTLAFGDIG